MCFCGTLIACMRTLKITPRKSRVVVQSSTFSPSPFFRLSQYHCRYLSPLAVIRNNELLDRGDCFIDVMYRWMSNFFCLSPHTPLILGLFCLLGGRNSRAFQNPVMALQVSSLIRCSTNCGHADPEGRGFRWRFLQFQFEDAQGRLG